MVNKLAGLMLSIGVLVLFSGEAKAGVAPGLGVSTGTMVGISTEAGTIPLSAEQLAGYFKAETPALQAVGVARLTELNRKNQEEADKIHAMVLAMADDGVVTSDEFEHLANQLKAYDEFVSGANQELDFYRMRILKDDRMDEYDKLCIIHRDHFLGDNRKQAIRRFFLNLTGKDVRVKLNLSKKIENVFGPAGLAGVILFALL